MATTAWHRIHIDELAPPTPPYLSSFLDNPVDVGISYQAGTSLPRTWSWQIDYAYWKNDRGWSSYPDVPSTHGEGTTV